MSVFFARKVHDRVELLTEGGSWNNDGILVHVREKVWRSPHIPLAVTTRGVTPYTGRAAAAVLKIAECGSFDLAMEVLEELLQEAVAEDAGWRPDGHLPLQVLIAGFSETLGPRLLYFNSENSALAEDAPLAPWTLVDAGSAINGMPYIEPADLAAVGITNALIASDRFLLDHGADLFEAGRKIVSSPWGDDHSPPHVLIAGHCDLTTVTAAGAVTRRLRTWPDRIGERIKPRADRKVVPITAGMNRQQRRAAERVSQKRQRA